MVSSRLGALALVLVSAACSPGSDDLFDPSGDAIPSEDGSGGNESSAGAGSESTGAGASGSGAAPAVGGEGVGASGNSGNTGNTGRGGAGASGEGASGGAGVGGSTGGSPNDPLLSCGNTSCSMDAGQSCCWDNYELSAPPKATCVSGPPNEDGCVTQVSGQGLETLISCQLPSHCPGQICCADRDFFNWQNGGDGTYYEKLSCQSECGFPDLHVCDPAAPNCPVVQTFQGPVQTVCKASELLPDGYYVCGTP